MLVNTSSYQNSSINAYKKNISETSKTAKNEDKSLEETLKEYLPNDVESVSHEEGEVINPYY